MDNASYEEDASIAKARAFVTACRFLLMMTPAMQMQDGKDQLMWSVTSIREAMESARKWISANPQLDSSGSSTGVRQYTFCDFGR